MREIFEQIIKIGENCIKFPFLLYQRDDVYTGISGLFSIAHNGDIYFFEEKTCNLVAIIQNEFIKELRLVKNYFKTEYVPQYIHPTPPANDAYLFEGSAKTLHQSEYEKKLAKYQVDLMFAEIHNKMEDEKKRASLGKTSVYTTTILSYYSSIENKEKDKPEIIKIDSFLDHQPYYYSLDRKLLNIPKKVYGSIQDCVRFVGTEEIGYIEVSFNKEIVSSKLLKDGFQLNFDGNTKIILKILRNQKIDDYLEKHKQYTEYNHTRYNESSFNSDMYDLTNSRICYFDQVLNMTTSVYPYGVKIYVNKENMIGNFDYQEVVVHDLNGDLIYFYSNSKEKKLFANMLVYYFYQARYLKNFSLLEEYSILDLKKEKMNKKND